MTKKTAAATLLLILSLAAGYYAQIRLEPNSIALSLLVYAGASVTFVLASRLVLVHDTFTAFPLGRLHLPFAASKRVADSPPPGSAPLPKAWDALFATLGSVALSTATWVRVGKNIGDLWSVVFWVGSLVLIVVAAVRYKRWESATSLPQRQTPWEWAMVVAIVLTGGLLRFYNLEALPRGVHGDEGMLGQFAVNVLAGNPSHIFGIGEHDFPNLYYYMQAFFVRILGISMTGVRFSSALFGTLGLLALFLLVRDLFSVRVGLIALFLGSVGGIAIHFSRIGQIYIHASTFILFTLFFLVRGIRFQRSTSFVWCGIMAGFAQYYYTGARILPLILIVACLYWILFTESFRKSNWIHLMFILVGFVVTVMPFLSTYLHNPGHLESRSVVYIFASHTWARDVHDRLAWGESWLRIVWDQSKVSFLAFNLYGDSSTLYGFKAPLLEFWTSIFFVFGIAWAVSRFYDLRYFLLLASLILVMFIGVALTESPPSYPRLTPIVPLLFVFPALALDIAFSAFLALTRFRAATIVLFMIVLGGVGSKNIDRYFGSYIQSGPLWGDREPCTDIGYRVRGLPQDVPVYMFRVPMHCAPVIRLTGHRYGVVENEPTENPVRALPAHLDKAVFIFLPEQDATRTTIITRYPGGVSDTIINNGKVIRFYALGVSSWFTSEDRGRWDFFERSRRTPGQ